MSEIKIHFKLTVDEDGYPPIGIESLNGDLISEGVAKIDNTPFFVEGVALGDVVNVAQINESNRKNYQFIDVEENSDNIALSVLFFEKEVGDIVHNYFSIKNHYCEYGHFPGFSMLAISVPKSEYTNEISLFLDELQEQEIISYAELSI